MTNEKNLWGIFHLIPAQFKPVFTLLSTSTTLRYCLTLLLLNIFTVAGALGQATVMTDKDDYQPGNYVFITGSGWQPGETVTLHFDEEPKPSTCMLPHDLTAVADANGNIYNNQFLVKENHLGVKFTLTATGQSSGLTATTIFTDATWTLSLNSNAAYCGGESRLVNFTVQQTNNSNRNESITIVFPTGWTISGFSSLSVTDNGGSPLSKSWTVSSINANTICLSAATSTTSPNPNRLDNNDKILFSATITAPISSSAGSFPITGKGRGNTTCSTTDGDSPTNPPNVTLSGTSDIFESYAILNFGGPNVFYDLKATTGNVDFNGANLGTFNGNQPLTLKGAENKIFKCGTRDITNGTLYYRIYPTGSPSGSFTSLNLPFASNDAGAGAGCQNQTWRQDGASVNVLAGLCDGNYTIEVYTGANYQGCGTGQHLANNGGSNYKATFTINSSGQSGIYQSAVILKLNGGGDTYYDLQGSTPNFDFSGSLGSFCTNGSLVIAGGENKTFKCPNNDILDKNKIFYRIYPAGSPSGSFIELALPFASNDGGALCAGGQNQTWRNNSNATNLLTGLTPGNYTLEVYTQASYTTNGICESIHYSNNGGANYKADFIVNQAPAITTVYNNITVNNDPGVCSAVITYAAANVTGTPPPTISYSHPSGSVFPVGTTTVTVTATNSCGTDTKTFTVTVNDTEAPTGTPPSAITNINSCLPTQTEANDAFNATLAASGYSDNCGGTVTALMTNATVSGTKCNWTITYTFSVKDQNDNVLANQTYTRSGGDKTAPTGTAPAAITNVDACLPTQTEADNAFNATLAASGYSDACGGVVTAELVSAVVSGDKCAWSILYTFKVKDECGNYLNNQTYTRSGGDKTAPVLTGTIPAGGTGINACAAPVGPTEAQIAALYTDACGGAITVVKTGSPTGTSCGWTVTYHYTIKDECGNFATAVDITYSGSDQTPPTWVTTAGSLDRTVYCGQLSALSDAQALAPIASDNCGGTITYVKTSGVFVSNGANSNGAGTYTNTWIAKDPCNNQTVIVFTQTITVLGITVDANASTTPVPINTAITLKAYVSPVTAGVTVYFYVDNTLKGSGITDATGLATYGIGSLPSEVYQVKAIAGSGCSQSLVYLPVYDPNGGFVTGGGWINSPAHALIVNGVPSPLTGKANFGFVAKYKKGSNQVDGNTEFQFHVGSFNFKSTVHDAGTLVISGSKATYRGTGTVNGSGNYGFLVTGIDGQVTGGGGYDKFRIKIWDKNNGNTVVYDNDMGLDENDVPSTAIAGGSIVIHNPKKSNVGAGANTITFTEAVTLPQKFAVKVLGNPSVNSFRLLLETTNTKDFISIKVVDINGRVVETRQNLTANQTVELGNNLTKGVYFAEVTQGAKKQVVKLIKIAYE